MDDRAEMIGQLNFTDPAALLTFHVTAKSGLAGFKSETKFDISDVPIYKWQIKRPPTPQPQNKCRCVMVIIGSKQLLTHVLLHLQWMGWHFHIEGKEVQNLAEAALHVCHG
jgi:hypothetical protein